MISEIISEILNDLGNYLLRSPFSAFVNIVATMPMDYIVFNLSLRILTFVINQKHDRTLIRKSLK